MAQVEHTMNMTDHLGRYNMIVGRDLLKELGNNLDFKENNIMWGDYQTDMKSADITMAEHLANMEASRTVAENMAKILEAKYCKVNLQTDVVDQCTTLNAKDKKKSLCFLQKHKELFDGTLGTWKDLQYNIELRYGAKLYHNRPYPVPKAYKAILHMAVEHLCKIGVLHKVNQSEWGASTFVIPKKDKW
eukprot:15365667-Ditylum_brightwellii.AAC.1